jgi:hypothetical protein
LRADRVLTVLTTEDKLMLESSSCHVRISPCTSSRG